MKFTLALSLCGVALGSSGALKGGRRLEQNLLAGYQPLAQITDPAALDLDQQTLEERTGVADFDHAKMVYMEGGHSGSYAQLTLINPGDNMKFPKGSTIVGTNKDGTSVFSTLLEDVSLGTMNGQNAKIKVSYTVSDNPSHHVDCQVGALYHFEAAQRKGCYKDAGKIELIPLGAANGGFKFNYTYDERADNKNFRTLQKLSTNAKFEMRGSNGKLYPDFKLFKDYYGVADYANKWVMSAFAGKSTNFTHGNADFSLLYHHAGRGRMKSITHGTWLLGVWMYVIRQMEHAIDLCDVPCTLDTAGECQDQAVAEWDSAVAYYAGSLQGDTGGNDDSRFFPYFAANKRAKEFKTAGYRSADLSGTSYVNLEIIFLFQRGQGILASSGGEVRNCNAVRHIKNSIVNLMKVPLVQTIYRYAWMRENRQDYEDRHAATGATYTAALLPFVHDCHKSHANMLYNYMRFDGTNINFARIKEALEEIYECLGISCAHVGGYYQDGDYVVGGSPCMDAELIFDRTPEESLPVAEYEIRDEGVNAGVAFAASFVVVAVLIMGAVIWIRNRAPKELDGSKNIAAVTAVSEVDLT